MFDCWQQTFVWNPNFGSPNKQASCNQVQMSFFQSGKMWQRHGIQMIFLGKRFVPKRTEIWRWNGGNWQMGGGGCNVLVHNFSAQIWTSATLVKSGKLIYFSFWHFGKLHACACALWFISWSSIELWHKPCIKEIKVCKKYPKVNPYCDIFRCASISWIGYERRSIIFFFKNTDYEIFRPWVKIPTKTLTP